MSAIISSSAVASSLSPLQNNLLQPFYQQSHTKRHKTLSMTIEPHRPPPSSPQIVYPFAHEVPFITVATMGIDPRQSAVVGNFLNPSYVPNLFFIYPLPMSLWYRLKNTAVHFWMSFYWRTWALPPVQEEVSILSM